MQKQRSSERAVEVIEDVIAEARAVVEFICTV